MTTSLSEIRPPNPGLTERTDERRCYADALLPCARNMNGSSYVDHASRTRAVPGYPSRAGVPEHARKSPAASRRQQVSRHLFDLLCDWIRAHHHWLSAASRT